MIKTLRYAFVAALMMVAGAVNAQTTFNFKNMWENIEPAGKDKTILYLNKSEANFGVHTIGDVTLAVIAGENPSGAPTYLRTTYKPNDASKARACIAVFGGKKADEVLDGSSIKISSKGEKLTKITFKATDLEKGGAKFTASVGTLKLDDSKVRNWTWTGNADEVTFTVSRKDQASNNAVLRFVEITVNPSGATGINNITVDNAKKGVRYNLAGQRVNESYKGVVIENGKKMIVK